MAYSRVQISSSVVVAAALLTIATGCGSHKRVAGAPDPGGYFTTLAAGAPLPTDAQCAARVHHSKWEPRSENVTANHKIVDQPVTLPDNSSFDATWQKKYKTRIDGNFVGTTDEIIQWASCKWGIADDVTRARAMQETKWKQTAAGDAEPRSNKHCAPGWSDDPCPTSFGILQSKWYFRPGTYPGTRTSTAFMLDSALAETRGCLDGRQFFGAVSKDDLWGCVGVWFSGEWGKNDKSYIKDVQHYFKSKPWLYWAG